MLDKIREASDSNDLGNEPDSGRSALPGFQAKLLIGRFDGTWHQPLRLSHSTHLVKPTNQRRPHLIFDEYYSHVLTRKMGLSSFDSFIDSISGTEFLVIERYDRQIIAPGEVLVTHQEDAAQARGLDWVDSRAKFQDPGYPTRPGRPTAATIAEIFGTIGDGSDAERWLQYLAFNVLVGNHDGHAKNVSIIHDENGSHIADAYDSVPILHINDEEGRRGEAKVKDELSLAIDGVFEHHRVTRENLLNEAASWGFSGEKALVTALDSTIESFANAASTTPQPKGSSPRLRDRLLYNADQIASGGHIGKPKFSSGTIKTRRQPRNRDLGKPGHPTKFAESIHDEDDVQLG